MSSLWSILRHGEDSSAIGDQHRHPRVTLLPAPGTHLHCRRFPRFPKHRNLTHPMFLNFFFFLHHPNSVQKIRYKQASPYRALPTQLTQ